MFLLGSAVVVAEGGSIDAADDARVQIEALLARGPGQPCAQGAWMAQERGNPDVIPALIEALKAEAAIPPGSMSGSRNHVLDALIELGAVVPTDLVSSRIELPSLTATLILLSRSTPLDRAAIWNVHAAAAKNTRECMAALWILSDDGDRRAIAALVSEVVLDVTAVVLDREGELDLEFRGSSVSSWMASHGHRPPRVDFVLRFWDGEEPIDVGDIRESERRGEPARRRPDDRLLTDLNREEKPVLPVSFDRFTGVRSGVSSPALDVRCRSQLAWIALQRLAAVPLAEREPISRRIAVRPEIDADADADVDAQVEVALDEEVVRFRPHLRGVLERLHVLDRLPQDLDPERSSEAVQVVRQIEDQREGSDR